MPFRRHLLLPALAATAALTLSACGAIDGQPGSGGGTTVVASAYPYAFVAERIAGDEATVQNLTAPGVEPHDVELGADQTIEVLEADLVVYERTFQPAVDEAVDQAVDDGDLDAGSVMDVADVVSLEDTGAEEAHDHGDDEHAEEHAADEESPLDPHVWLDPVRMVEIAEATGDQLAEVDPDHADTYEQNTADLVADLEQLDRDFAQGLADCGSRTLVTAHDAFRYLAARYDLDVVAIAGIDPAQEPSPSEQAAIADLVREQGITTIFTEELVDPGVADSIAAETGARTAVLSPIEGLTDETADEDYLSLMRENLAALQRADACG